MLPRLVIADDHGIVREGIELMLRAHNVCEVVGEASNGLEVVDVVTSLKPDLVLMDVRMPGLNGIDATRQIVQKMPGVRVIALSAHSDVRSVAEMLRAGASGYVVKGSNIDELIAAIKTVADGRTYLSPPAAETVVDSFVRSRSDGGDSVWSTLATRERQVLQMLAEGSSSKMVAHRLGISDRTVERHRASLMEKLGLETVADLTKFAIREGLISLED